MGENKKKKIKYKFVTKKLRKKLHIESERGICMKDIRRKSIFSKKRNQDIKKLDRTRRCAANDEESQVIREAEKIVEKYMGKKRQKIHNKTRISSALLVSVGTVILSICMVIIAFFV